MVEATFEVHWTSLPEARIDEALIGEWIENRLNDGRTVFVRAMSRGRGATPARGPSNPGQYPVTGGGRLVGSVDSEMTGPLEGRLFSDVEYAAYLAMGTRKMAPRKMLDDALEEALSAPHAEELAGAVILSSLGHLMIIDPADFGYDNLPSAVTRQIRGAGTLFGQSVKLVMRELDKDMWSSLPPNYLLVVPTVTRPSTREVGLNVEISEVVLPRSITLIAQVDSKNSVDDHAAAQVLEDAEKQLISCLVGWRPHPGYLPAGYAGMRFEASRTPLVKASFVFIFTETLGLDCPEPGCAPVEDEGSELGMVQVRPIDLTCEVDPCP